MTLRTHGAMVQSLTPAQFAETMKVKALSEFMGKPLDVNE